MIDLPPMYHEIGAPYEPHALYPYAFNDDSLTMKEKMAWFFIKNYDQYAEVLELYLFNDSSDEIYGLCESLRDKRYISEEAFRDLFKNDPRD